MESTDKDELGTADRVNRELSDGELTPRIEWSVHEPLDRIGNLGEADGRDAAVSRHGYEGPNSPSQKTTASRKRASRAPGAGAQSLQRGRIVHMKDERKIQRALSCGHRGREEI